MSETITYEKMPEFELDAARFDQPSVAGARPDRAYAICSTPRSGSWLLCRQLVNAGLGVPSEYFNVTHSVPLGRRWKLDERDTLAYLRALREKRTTPNGVWGTKLLWTQYADRRAALKIALLRECRHVFLYREDVVPQAVSLHLSQLTGIWDFDGTVCTAPRTDIPWGDPAHLDECARTVRDQNRRWRELFVARGIEPLVVRYEDLVVDQPGTVGHIARWLGLDASEYRVPPPEPRDTAFPADIEERRRTLVAQWRDALAARGAG